MAAYSKKDNIFFSETNLIPSAELSHEISTAVTDINYMKDHRRSRLTRWRDLDNIISINARFKESTVDYVAVPGFDLPNAAYAVVRLYDKDDNVLAASPKIYAADLIPAALFEASVDKFGVSRAPLNNLLFYRWPTPFINVARVRYRIHHGLDYVAPVTPESPAPTVETDNLYQQNNGVVSIESNSAENTAVASGAWILKNDPVASGGKFMEKDNDTFFWQHTNSPSLTFKFRATSSGAHKVWLRLQSPGSKGNSLYTICDGKNNINVIPVSQLSGQGWQWFLTATINLVEGQVHVIKVAARDENMSIDKLVVAPSGAAKPSGNGPNQSSFGTKLVYADTATPDRIPSLEKVDIRMLMAGKIMQLEENFDSGILTSQLTDVISDKNDAGFSLNSKEQRRVRRASLQLSVMEPADLVRFTDWEIKTRGQPFIVSLYPNGTAYKRELHQYLCKFVSRNDYSQDEMEISSARLEIEEV